MDKENNNQQVEIKELESLIVTQLKEIWIKDLKDDNPPSRKAKLVKELAYRLQAKEHGDLDKNTKVTIARRVKAYEDKLNGKTQVQAANAKKLTIEVGCKLIKEYKGQTIEVDVIGDKEFKYEGEVYKSLSAIAQEITGQHMSGPRFSSIN